MLALLSTFIGFLTSMSPEILAFFKDSKDKKHELEVMETQARLGLQQAQVGHDTAQVQALTDAFTQAQQSYRAEIKAAKDSWVAAYAATVRPTITYFFFFLYTIVKIKILLYALTTLNAQALPWQVETAMKMIWTEEDVMMFSWVIGFWLGSRSMQKKF